MLFGKKKNVTPPPESVSADRIVTMPDIFYGGADPTIYPHTSKTTEHVLNTSPVVPPRAAPQPARSVGTGIVKNTVLPPTSVAPAATARPKNIATWVSMHHTRVIIIAVIIFLIALLGIIWYYVRPATVAPGNQREQTPGVPVVVVPPVIPVTVVTPVTTTILTPVATSTPVVVPTTTPSLSLDAIIFPSLFLVDTPDADLDSLTDAEEETFGTDPGIFDTDNDGYYDGQELSNLYNPRGLAPIRLIDSGLVREYVSSLWAYRLYYPASWVAATVESSGTQVLVSSPTGEFFTMTASQKSAGESFSSWFARTATGQQFSDLLPFTNRFDVGMLRRRDGLVYYIDSKTAVFVLTYNTTASNDPISYRHIFGMTAQSIRTDNVLRTIPDQVPLPVLTTSTP